MKLFSIIVLLSIFFSAFAADLSLDGPHGDGRFLADPDSATAKPCESGKFNMLQFSGTKITNWDGATDKFIKKCESCDKTDFLEASTTTAGAGYSKLLSGLENDGDDKHSDFNRRECCFNSDNAVCREQIRAYKEGCHDTGAYVQTTNDEGYGGGTCS